MLKFQEMEENNWATHVTQEAESLEMDAQYEKLSHRHGNDLKIKTVCLYCLVAIKF